MSYLLDTHTLLWLRLDPGKLPAKHRAILADPRAQKYISTLAIWEISLKFAIGKLTLGGHTPEEFLETALQLGLQIAQPTATQYASFHNLPLVDGHKDPFDRMLIWQAIQNHLMLLSSDPKMPDYQVHGLAVA